MFALCLLVVLVRETSSCRWAIYAGSRAESAASLFTLPAHALCGQGWRPRLNLDAAKALYYDEDKFNIRNHEINKDGWGLGWYSTQSGKLKRYRDEDSAVDEANAVSADLNGIAHAVRSQVMMAHLRASINNQHSTSNSHPFEFNQLMWMHNGGVPAAVQRKLEALMTCKKAKSLVAGTTDSEHLAAYFISKLNGEVCSRDNFTLQELQAAMRNTTAVVEALEEADEWSSLNLAVSDGKHVVVTRHRTKRDEDPPGLYYARTEGSLWIASEPLDGQLKGTFNGSPRMWIPLAKDQMLSYDVRHDSLHLECLSEACTLDMRHRAEHELQLQVDAKVDL